MKKLCPPFCFLKLCCILYCLTSRDFQDELKTHYDWFKDQISPTMDQQIEAVENGGSAATAVINNNHNHNGEQVTIEVSSATPLKTTVTTLTEKNNDTTETMTVLPEALSFLHSSSSDTSFSRGFNYVKSAEVRLISSSNSALGNLCSNGTTAHKTVVQVHSNEAESNC